MTRWYVLGVISLWLVAMGWLLTAKVFPLLRGGKAPDASVPLPAPGQPPLVESWKLRWNDRPLGWAVCKTRRREDGWSDVRSAVHFDRFPVEEFLERVLGPVAWLLRSEGASGPVSFSFEIRSWAVFLPDGHMKQFDSTLDIDEFAGLLLLHGEIKSSGKLALTVRTLDERSTTLAREYREVFRHEVDLPPGSQVSDSLSPQSRLAGLAPGQTWTFPVYRAFPPNSPVQLVEAKAEQHEIIYWNGEPVETLLVEFRKAGGGELAVASDSLGRLWVREDGTVLVQELEFASTRFQFERIEPAQLPAAAQELLADW